MTGGDAAGVRGALSGALPAMLADLGALVECESPSTDLPSLARCTELVAELGSRLLGRPPERLLAGDRTHLRWRFGARDGGVLLLGHFDTVWPLGSLRSHPFAVADGRASGPGCFDMKAGVVQLLHALSALPALDGIEVLLTADEELGAPTSRPLIQDSARRAGAALVLEGSADGALKVARKGIGVYVVEVAGRAAHAGLDPEKGVNAVVEMAHQVLRIAALGDPAAGTTVTPTVLHGGSADNTVPAEARLSVDVRAASPEEQRRVAGQLESLVPQLPGAVVSVRTLAGHPPMPESASRELFAAAQRAAESLGLPPLRGLAVGGASDGNITAGEGTPTLDGLGAVGGGAHAADEHVVVAAMPERAALVAVLAEQLRAGGR